MWFTILIAPPHPHSYPHIRTIRSSKTSPPREQGVDDVMIAGLWALVNNAGIAARRSGPLDWLDVDDFRRVMEVNLFGMVRVTKACLPLLKLTRGRIVNVTSAAGRLALARKGPYDSSKFAAEAFSDIIR